MLNIMTGVLQSSAYCLFVRYLVCFRNLYPVPCISTHTLLLVQGDSTELAVIQCIK